MFSRYDKSQNCEIRREINGFEYWKSVSIWIIILAKCWILVHEMRLVIQIAFLWETKIVQLSSLLNQKYLIILKVNYLKNWYSCCTNST